MSNINEEARIPVYLNDQQARSALKNLTAEADKWRRSMHEAMEQGDMKGMKAAEREMKKANREASALRKSTFDVNKVLNDLSSASTRDIRQALRLVNKEMDGLNRNSIQYAQLQEKARLLKNELRGVNTSLKEQRGLFAKTADFVKRYWAIIGSGFAVFAGGRRMVNEANQAFTGFEERVSNLSALTKLQGEELEYLSQTALDTAGATIEGNIRIKQSASEIADAYTVVGSKRPELLRSKEALAAVTQEAIILSNAAQGPLSESVNGLTMALNQFEMGADQSRRIINTLAAGAQEGAGNVAYLTEAMEKSGTTANMMGVEIEQWAGAIEAIAPFYTRASVAGNSFDKVLMRMRTNQIGYVNGVFNLNAALDELEKRYEAGESATDIFGQEHAKMAELLVQNRDEVIRYTEAVTDSQAAIDSAITNSDNEAAKRAAAAARRNAALVKLGEMFAPVFTRASEASASAVEMIVRLIDVVVENRTTFISLAAAVATYTVAMKLANAESRIRLVLGKGAVALNRAWAVSKGLLTGQIKIATIAQRAWNAAQKANPIILLASVLVGAGVALARYARSLKEQSAAQKAYNEVTQAAEKGIVQERLELEQLLRVARDESRSKEERADAMKQINSISPEYLGGLTLEKINTDEARVATEAYIKKLVEKQMVQEATNKIVELEMEYLEKSNQSNYEWLSRTQQVGAAMIAMLNKEIGTRVGLGMATRNQAEYEEERAKILERLYSIIDEGSDSRDDSEPSVGTRKTVGNTVYEWDGRKWKVVEEIGEGDSDDHERDHMRELEDQYAKERTLIKRQHLEGKLTQDEYHHELLRAELEYFDDKLKLLEEGSREYEETLTQAMEKQVAVDNAIKEILKQAEKELADAKIQSMQDGLDKQHQIELKRWGDEKQTLQTRIIEKQTLSEQEILHNDTVNAILQEREREHHDKMREIRELAHLSDLEDRVTASTPLDENFATLEQQEEFFNARVSLLEAQYARERQLAGDNQSAIMAAERNYHSDILKLKNEQIEAEFATAEQRGKAIESYLGMFAGVIDQETDLGKALFLFNQANAIGQVWIDIAKANAKAIAASPLTLGQPWVGVNTTQGGIQTALIAAQTVAKFAGKKSGGYTDHRMTDDDIVDLVHSNEFVATADAVRNPTIKPILDIIDMAQKNNRIASLNLPAALSSIGRRAGGYGAFDSSQAPASSPAMTPAADPEIATLIRETRDVLTHLRNQGVKGVWDFDYHQRSLDKMNDIEARSRT